MNVENIDKLIDHLENIPRRAFDLSDWLHTSDRFYDVESRPDLARELIELQRSSKGKGHYCGTAGCIAGYAQVLSVAEEDGSYVYPEEAGHVGREFLGLSDEQAQALFTPEARYFVDWEGNASWKSVIWDGGEGRFTEVSLIRAWDIPTYEAVTAARAVQVLRHLRETGKVDWRVVKWPTRFHRFRSARPDLATAI